MNNIKMFKRLSIITLILCALTMLCSISFAAWWGTPGYEWALQNGLTGVKTKPQLDQTVELDDLYATILKYLSMKGILPKNGKVHHTDKMDGMDNVAKGLCDIINGYNDRESLTIQQFYIVENYVDKGYKMLEEYRTYSQYLTRQDLKNIETYLRLSKYRAATLIADRSDREYALSRLGYIKNSKIINYGMLPYSSKISRREFLELMYDLLSGRGGDAINTFYDSGVLIGYDTGLELDKLINYVEMYTFLYRFEIFDFEANTVKNALSDIKAYILRALEGDIVKSELINYLEDVAAQTNYQVDLIADLENDIGYNWSTREAGEYINKRYTEEGFTYTNGSEVIRVQG